MNHHAADASQGEAQYNMAQKEAVVHSLPGEDVVAQTTVGLQRQLKARHLSMIALGTCSLVGHIGLLFRF